MFPTITHLFEKDITEAYLSQDVDILYNFIGRLVRVYQYEADEGLMLLVRTNFKQFKIVALNGNRYEDHPVGCGLRILTTRHTLKDLCAHFG